MGGPFKQDGRYSHASSGRTSLQLQREIVPPSARTKSDRDGLKSKEKDIRDNRFEDYGSFRARPFFSLANTPDTMTTSTKRQGDQKIDPKIRPTLGLSKTSIQRWGKPGVTGERQNMAKCCGQCGSSERVSAPTFTFTFEFPAFSFISSLTSEVAWAQIERQLLFSNLVRQTADDPGSQFHLRFARLLTTQNIDGSEH